MNNSTPTVSIGMPVYNGSNFINESIQAILNQTFQDWELIISDNASTDNTPEICRQYVQKDSRIKYFRNETNLGISPNLNRAFELSRGRYFRWSSHDDLIAPEYLNSCVEILDSNPDVVLCHSFTRVINEKGEITSTGLNNKSEACVDFLNSDNLKELDSPNVAVRFHALSCKAKAWTHTFALIRREALEKTNLFGGFGADDKILVGHLSLIGRFYTIDKPLFFYRRHSSQSTSLGRKRHVFSIRINQANGNKLIFPAWRILGEYMGIVRITQLTFTQRLKCYFSLVLAFFKIRAIYELLEDIVVVSIQVIVQTCQTVLASLLPNYEASQELIFDRFPRLEISTSIWGEQGKLVKKGK